jgi:hypothetical protein
MAISKDYQQSSIQQGSVGIEYQLAGHTAVSATYLRARGNHLYHWQDINLFEPTLTSIGISRTATRLSYRGYNADNRPYEFDRILLLNSNGHSSYHALVLQANRRFSGSYQLAGSYTLSRTIDDNPTLGALNPGPGDVDLLSDSFDPSLDRGEADYSQRHRFVASGIWSLDYARHMRGSMKALLDGWQLSGIFTAQSGRPYSGYVPNIDLNRDGNPVTDRTPGLARNTFSHPTTISLDLRLTREIPVRRVRLQASCEAFNVFNRANIQDVKTAQFSRSTSPSDCGIAGTPCLVPDETFGTPVAAREPRAIQFAVRIVF